MIYKLYIPVRFIDKVHVSVIGYIRVKIVRGQDHEELSEN